MEFVSSLVRHDPGLVQLWWPEWLIPGYDWGVNPDHLVVIDTSDASALVLVEVDESTERPPVIRDRLHAYAKLFDQHRTGWHLLWVANSPERLARLRQIAGPTKLPMLSGRCWGVVIDDVSDRGADAAVLAIGAGLEPRPLRGIATDPKARRSEYEVGSAAWISLLANGGRQDMDQLWQGVERARTEPVPVAVAVESVVEEVTKPAAPDALATTSVSVTAEEPAAPHDQDEDLHLMFGGELVRLILGAGGEGSRAARAFELLAERGTAHYLLDDLEVLSRSRQPEQQLQALGVIRNLRVAANDQYRQRARDLLLQLVDQRNELAVVKAALAALEATGPRQGTS